VIAESVAPTTIVAVNQRAGDDASSTGISWPAVFGGALVEAAIALILVALGAGFGLAMASPWTAGGSTAVLGAVGVVWLLVMQILASGLGGYLAGRLRSRWTTVHTDEVYFRDTAHGFLAWALGVVITVSLLASAVGSVLGAAARANGAIAGAASPAGVTSAAPGSYYVDMLLRSNRAPDAGTDAAARAEGGRLLVHLLTHPDDATVDTSALSELVGARTGLSARDADARVTEVVTHARQAVDTDRRAAEHVSFWTFIALLVGAFCASWAATIGGRQRDHVLPATSAAR
jgi:hypothetical protein